MMVQVEQHLNNLPAKILMITTGGTIEKSYDEQQGVFDNREGIIDQQLLSRIRLSHTHLKLIHLMNKDSLVMTETDRMLIAKTILAQLKSKDVPRGIVVLHGTDTMELSVDFVLKFLKNELNVAMPQELGTSIIFTGAMSPSGLEQSDAFQNVVEALMCAKIAPFGLFISFHNQLFEAGKVTKNREKKTFVWK